jgi:hypothetical protein
MADETDETAGQTVDAAGAIALPAELPKGLLKRGRELWQDMTTAHRFDAGSLVILAEACRTADRCERLDAYLRGRSKEWLTLVDETGTGRVVIVKMDGALREARQQQLALRALLSQLGVGKAATAAPATTAKRSAFDELTERRRERERMAAGGALPSD